MFATLRLAARAVFGGVAFLLVTMHAGAETVAGSQTNPAMPGCDMAAHSRDFSLLPAITGPGACGAARVYKVSSLGLFRPVVLKPAAVLTCEMAEATHRWLQGAVQPLAKKHMARALTGMTVAASYSCRTRNNKKGGKLSEHARANALDLSVFIFAGGQQVSVKDGWGSGALFGLVKGAEHGFLKDVHKAACSYFSTVIGPDGDRYHHDHFHLDMQARASKYRYCR